MNLLIDTNCFHKVFETKTDCEIYASVYKSLFEGKLILIYGGTKYIRELTHQVRYHKVVNILKSKNLVKVLECTKVDTKETVLSTLFIRNDYDDHHLLAIILLGNVRVVCTDDQGARSLIKEKTAYTNGHKRPRIYSKPEHVKLFNKK